MQSLELWWRLASQNGIEGKTAFMMNMLALVLIAGLWGLPWADEMRRLYEWLHKKFTSEDIDLKTEIQKAVYQSTGSVALAQAANKGVAYPMGMDLSRIGVNKILPESELQMLGIPADLLIGRPMNALEEFKRGHVATGTADLSPNFAKNMIHGYDWAKHGVRSQATGNTVIPPEKLSKTDIAQKVIGFTPPAVTTTREAARAVRREEHNVDDLRRLYQLRTAETIVERTRARKENDANQERALDAELKSINAEMSAHDKGRQVNDRIRTDGHQWDMAIDKKVRDIRLGVKSSEGKERKQDRSEARRIREAYGVPSAQRAQP